ncbi:MAG TPA: polysaccharide deacetylase family protein [Desulfobacteraceae bacterium]|nr:polysaccharide deacetylase family protein [Desulfobacteraceae bacterium]HPJ68058.1 polysaccharide deacetylase family protein [Desulfobacteraceae bacterium]HPQ28399.1 polysaccharide deacetylase family protein [Desulfobacteraceae bacterium]
MIHVGLRIDVDTLRGTRTGVPNLIDLLARYNIRASFFFSMGPDNMGRHLWRLMHPTFLIKMLRTSAARLYGWDTLMRGTLCPGPVIGQICRDTIRNTAGAGHEIGLHAWDHYRWQTRVERMDRNDITLEIQRGYNLLTDIIERHPDCFAAPGWRITPEALIALDGFAFRFESDCRGYSIFRPVFDVKHISHVQVPATLPTYDELIGIKCTPETYNNYLLNLIRPNQLNVLTIHAEVEGINCLPLFQDFVDRALQKGIVFGPLGEILSRTKNIAESTVCKSSVTGREGWVACQENYQTSSIYEKVRNL